MTLSRLEATQPYSTRAIVEAVCESHHVEEVTVVTDASALAAAIETPHDGVVLVDSLMTLAHAANRIPNDEERSGLLISGIISERLSPLKRLLAQARDSAIAVLVIVEFRTGSRMDEVILSEFSSLLPPSD